MGKDANGKNAVDETVARINRSAAVWVAVVAGLFGIATGYVGRASTAPPQVSVPVDPGHTAILDFYRYVGQGDFGSAWSLLHPARQKEVAASGIVDPATFGTTYATTDVYRNLSVHLDHEEPTGARLYWVSYDVADILPESLLFRLFSRPVSELVEQGVVNGDRLVTLVLADLRRHFQVEDAQVPDVLRVMFGAKAFAVFGPKMISEVARQLKLSPVAGGPTNRVWSRFIQHIEMQSQSGWKIRRGLFPPTLEAFYPAGTEVPTWTGDKVPPGR